jgi:hypothetical protein
MQIDKTEFVNWLKIKGLSKRTILEYLNYLEDFDVSKLSQNYIVEYLVNKKHSNNVARAFLKNIFLFIKTNESIPKETKILLVDIDIPKITGRKKKRLPEIVTEQEMMRIVSITKN